ncbi:MAG: chemotaxis protein CheZ, partial [Caballeronia sp.]|nr:chemotaxis protein CheZ [Caballeronia sp.]
MNEMTNETLIDAEQDADASSDRILARIGQLTRTLRDSMR